MKLPLEEINKTISQLDKDTLLSLRNIKHGVERETLRVNQSGGLAQTTHPRALGSALKHEWITTDFSESLMEFITPPESNIEGTVGQLVDIHKFVYENIDQELLWPMSMPCFIDQNTSIPIARYGNSNIAKMKEVYRKGLHNRYGSMMQVIAGVHLNFSFADDFWQGFLASQGQAANITTISSAYFSLVRNFRANAWLVPYLFGASPALCKTFLGQRQTPYSFENLGKGTLYLPYATSLRMSDLGYTSAAQSSLTICYNDLSSYVKSVRNAINLRADMYAHIAAGENGQWDQLNRNVLQIENELYAPIRPKQVANYLEKPTDALASRGVQYIEVRGLDVNPFSQVGIDAQQIRFMDAFLLYCLLKPSPHHEMKDHEINRENMKRIVIEGRKPSLRLMTRESEKDFQALAGEIFEGIRVCARLLDDANACHLYSESVDYEYQKIEQAELTFSGRLLNVLKENQIDNSRLGLELAKEYKANINKANFRYIERATFEQESRESIERQLALEKEDNLSFDVFVKDYFASAKVS